MWIHTDTCTRALTAMEQRANWEKCISCRIVQYLFRCFNSLDWPLGRVFVGLLHFVGVWETLSGIIKIIIGMGAGIVLVLKTYIWSFYRIWWSDRSFTFWSIFFATLTAIDGSSSFNFKVNASKVVCIEKYRFWKGAASNADRLHRWMYALFDRPMPANRLNSNTKISNRISPSINDSFWFAC